MNDKTVPYIVFESISARLERTIKRLWIMCIILILVLIGTNAGWLYYESQFEYFEVTQEATATGENDISLIGGDCYGWQSEADCQR